MACHLKLLIPARSLLVNIKFGFPSKSQRILFPAPRTTFQQGCPPLALMFPNLTGQVALCKLLRADQPLCLPSLFPDIVDSQEMLMILNARVISTRNKEQKKTQQVIEPFNQQSSL